MSCITEILKLKDEDGLVRLPSRREGKVSPALVAEGGGIYRGYEYIITFTDLGHRCGYVAIPPSHPLASFEEKSGSFDSMSIDCHGGLTFHSRKHGLKSLLKHHCEDPWIGFDCAHCFDGKDFDCLEKYYGRDCQQLKFYEEYPHFKENHMEVVRDYKYVEGECKKIIRQLRRMDMGTRL